MVKAQTGNIKYESIVILASQQFPWIFSPLVGWLRKKMDFQPALVGHSQSFGVTIYAIVGFPFSKGTTRLVYNVRAWHQFEF